MLSPCQVAKGPTKTSKKRPKEVGAGSGRDSNSASISNSPRNDHLDLDLVPDRDWSSRSSNDDRKKSAAKEKVVVSVDVHADGVANVGKTAADATSKKRNQFQKKRQKTMTTKEERKQIEKKNLVRPFPKEWLDRESNPGSVVLFCQSKKL